MINYFKINNLIRKKSVFTFLFLLTIGTFVFAQDTNKQNKKIEPLNPKPSLFDNWQSRIFTGGNMGMQFGTITFIDISPLVGYRVTEKFSAGVGATYRYMRQNWQKQIIDSRVIGGRVFARYSVLDNLFIHAEHELLNSDWYYTNNPFNVQSTLAGLGYVQPISDRASFMIMGLWNVYYNPIPIYVNPIIRVGFNIGF